MNGENPMNRREPTLPSDNASFQAVEKAITQGKTLAQPESRGVHDDIRDIETDMAAAQEKLLRLKQRLAKFDALQKQFYNGGAS